MAKILFAWELGGGSGHLAPFFLVAKSIIDAGHLLTLAVRDVTRATALFQGLPVQLVPAPPTLTSKLIANPVTYAQILRNVGFGEPHTCEAILCSWRQIFQRVRPDLVLADHAPGALLAARCFPIPAALIGNGFFIPPDQFPMPPLYDCTDPNKDLRSTPDWMADETHVTRVINQSLTALGGSTIDWIGQLFNRSQLTFLTTFCEFDHYDQRPGANYRGVVEYRSTSQTEVSWPSGTGPRVFAYLKHSNGLGHLFDRLASHGIPTIVYAANMDLSLLRRIAKPNLMFIDQPLPIDKVARQCDLAILNATHGTTCSILLAGKPVLQIPHNLEQVITAKRSIALGAACAANKNDGPGINYGLELLLNQSRYRQAAERFATRYSNYDANETADKMGSEIIRSIA